LHYSIPARGFVENASLINGNETSGTAAGV